MRYLISNSNNPYFNLAAEEFFCKQQTEDLLFFYVNNPAVVVGKHQNALAETNYNYLVQNSIPLIRRISGGGTVYHDLGNLNFSFHTNVADPSKTIYSNFLEPVKRALNNLNIQAEISSRNDITVNEFKVTGHAAHVYKKRVLSHGTLLINADMTQLSAALKVASGQFEGKAIASVRSKVSNINNFKNEPITINRMISEIVTQASAIFGEGTTEYFDPEKNQSIIELVHSKYATWEWNFGYSPRYQFSKETIEPNQKPFFAQITVEKGIIIQSNCHGGEFNSLELLQLNEQLTGTFHQKEAIMKTFSQLNSDIVERLLNALF